MNDHMSTEDEIAFVHCLIINLFLHFSELNMWATVASDMWSVGDLDTDRSSPESIGSADSTHLSSTTASGGEEIDSPPPSRTASTCRNTKKNKPAAVITSTSKPKLSYIALISNVILESPEKRILLSDIYAAIMDKYPYYALTDDSAWKNSIRHNLSLNECFVKNGRSDNGKGNFWAIHPACQEDFKRGDFRRRQARRKSKRCVRGLESSNPLQHQSMSSLPYPYNVGYVTMNKMPTGYPQMPSCYQQLPGQYTSPSLSPTSQPSFMTSHASFMTPQASFSTSPTSHPSFLTSSPPQYASQLTSYANYLHAHGPASGAPPNVNPAQLTQLGSLSACVSPQLQLAAPQLSMSQYSTSQLSPPQLSTQHLSTPQLSNPQMYSAPLYPTSTAFYPTASSLGRDNFQLR